jgi:uncharacterized protein (TIGR03086 family)
VTSEDDAAVLRRALDQLGDLLEAVDTDALEGATPCAEWTVQDLVDHIVVAPGRFARMMRGEQVDWSAGTPAAGVDLVGAFRSAEADLLRACQDRNGSAGPGGVDWPLAELAVHTWDLATALGRPTRDLDPEVAERGLAFMRANLTDARRGQAFGPEQPAPDDADAYQRIAAFAGRRI